MDLLEGLNAAQREAVTTTEGFVRVIAGAGSGKTRALTRRFAYLVTELGILPGNLLCVTFTNKAANEMRQRIHNLTGDNDTGYINTFHGFCVSILQEDSHAVGYPKSFLVLDNSDIDAMLQIIYDERGLTLRDMTFSHARDMIEMLKLKERPDYYEDMITLPLDTLKEKYDKAESAKDIIFYGYLYQEKKCFALDYNDLIEFSLHIFRTHEDIRLKWQKRLEYIMIDEFQDIDPPQYELMQVLCDHHKNLFIVGDPDQTIYTWRGADVRFLLDFDKVYPTTKTILMMENYRSTPQILAVCNSLIEKNQDRIKKELRPMLPAGEGVLCHHAANSEQEARWLAGKMQELHAAGVRYRDMAVLYRAHYITRGVEEVLLKEKIPYTIYSGVQFFARAEIKDALSYLRMIACRDDLSFLRIANVPKRNLGERRMTFLKDYAAQNGCSLYDALRKNLDGELLRGTKAGKFVSLIERFTGVYDQMPVSELLAAVLNESGYETMLRTEGSQMRLDNLAELKQSIYAYETTCGEECTLEHYLAHVAMFTSADLDDPRDQVRLMTVHSAKGLEFPHVFLCAMNEGIFPSKKTRTMPGMEEERRLCFVAMTRAQKGLYLSEAEGRNLDGSPRYPSRFLLDIRDDLLTFTKTPREDLIRQAREYIGFSSRFLRLGRSEGPGALAEDGDGLAVLADGVDRKVGRADHEVLVDHGVVDAELAAVLQRLVLEVADRVGKAHAEREMAAGVLVKEGVVEQEARLVDGRVKRHQRAFAKIPAALVHLDELGEQLVVLLRVPFDGLALVEADPEAVDQLTLVGKRLRRIDDALGHTAHRGDEAFLGRDVGVEEDALQARLAAAAELRLGDHADGKIGAVGRFVAQLADVQAVEIFAAVMQVLVVLFPCLDGVVGHAGGLENGFPQLFHGLRRAQLREELLGPLFARHGRDAPLVFVFDLVAVALDDGVLGLLGLGHLLLVDAAQTVGILTDEVDAAGDGVDIVLPAGFLVVIEGGQRLQTAVAHVQLRERLIAPVDDDLLRLQLVALVDHHRNELRLVELRLDKDLLSLLDVHAGLGDELRIFAQDCFFHKKASNALISFCLLL